MLSFTGSLKAFLAVEPADLRKSFNGLHALVTETLGEDPRTGALFVFCNRRRTRLKILLFDGTGLWVCTKRLLDNYGKTQVECVADTPGVAAGVVCNG